MEREYNESLPAEGGTLFIGEKGIMFCGTYGEAARLLPTRSTRTSPCRRRSTRIPEAPGMFGSQADFMRACTRGRRAALLELPRRFRPLHRGPAGGQPGHAGGPRQEGRVGRRTMKCTNMPELNRS